MLKRRHVYVLVFAVPSLLLALVVAACAAAASAGVLWLFVFGDNPWPAAADSALGAMVVAVGISVWFGLLFTAYLVGRGEEAAARLNRSHLAVAIGVTVLLAVAIAARTAGVRFTARMTDEELCADFCRSQGFAASGTPPRSSGDRTCSCYDAQGRESRHVALPEAAR